MAELVLFHHAQGLTAGVRAFADDLGAAGHRVHLPDLYQGRTFDTLEAGVAHVEAVGLETLVARGVEAVADLPAALVYAGFSLGAMPAQKLAQTRAGARGAVLLHAAIPLDAFGGAWPAGVPLQIHTMADDAWGDVDVARALEAEVPGCALFLYPGDRHLFTDRSLDAYDPAAAAEVTGRVLAFLAEVDRAAAGGLRQR